MLGGNKIHEALVRNDGLSFFWSSNSQSNTRNALNRKNSCLLKWATAYRVQQGENPLGITLDNVIWIVGNRWRSQVQSIWGFELRFVKYRTIIKWMRKCSDSKCSEFNADISVKWCWTLQEMSEWSKGDFIGLLENLIIRINSACSRLGNAGSIDGKSSVAWFMNVKRRKCQLSAINYAT